MSSLVSVCRPDSGQSFLSSAPKIRHCAWLEIQAGALYKYYCVHSGVAIPPPHTHIWALEMGSVARFVQEYVFQVEKHKLSEILVDRSTASALRSYVPGWR